MVMICGGTRLGCRRFSGGRARTVAWLRFVPGLTSTARRRLKSVGDEMKLDEIQVGEEYEVKVGFVASRGDLWGQYRAEVLEVRVPRRVRRNGYIQDSRKSDGVLVQLLDHDEAVGEFAIASKDVLRPWSERQAELDARDEEKRKLEARRTSERLRVARADEVLTMALGEFPRPTSMSGPQSRIELRFAEYGDAVSKAHVFLTNIEQVDRLRRLVEYGLEHEKKCRRAS